MPIYFLPDGELFAVYDDKPKKKFRPVISKLLRSKFGTSGLTTQQVTNALFYAFDWYSQEFLKILREENEVAFYQSLFGLHEFASKAHQTCPNKAPIPQMDDQDFALYRRILKLCLEQACDIELKRTIIFPTHEFLKSKELIIEDLLYLGDFLYEFADLLAQQHMIEDCVDLKFTDEGLFYFTYKHHYGFVIEQTLGEFGGHLTEAVVGENDIEDFKRALKESHNVSFDDLVSTIILMQQRNEKHGGKMAMEEWWAYPKNLELLFKVPYEIAEQVFSGLTLRQSNKMSLRDAIFRPYHINKYLYRPLLVWNVKGKDRAIVGEYIFKEAIVSLCTNALGWNKYPPEWANSAFQNFVKVKVEANDKILEDAVELALNENAVLFDRNVKCLEKWNNRNIDIDNADCGEIDFLFIHNDILFICDSKHLISRYDMNNFRNDYAAFETSRKSYNKTIARKIEFFRANLNLVEEHFQVLNDNPSLRLEVDIQGIFVVNTPTFIMYNNEYRIYTLKDFKQFLANCFDDKIFSLLIDDVQSQTLINVKYPYFKRPEYLVFDPEGDGQ